MPQEITRQFGARRLFRVQQLCNRLCWRVAAIMALFMASVTSPLAAKSDAHGEKITTIAVLEAEVSGVDASYRRVIAESLTDELQKVKSVHLVERTKITAILKEHELVQSGLTCQADDCAIKVGEMAAAQKVLMGSFTHTMSGFYLDVRIIDVAKGKVDFTAHKEFTTIAELNDNIRKIGLLMKDKYSPDYFWENSYIYATGGIVFPVIDSSTYLKNGWTVNLGYYRPFRIGYWGIDTDFMTMKGKNNYASVSTSLYSVSGMLSVIFPVPVRFMDLSIVTGGGTAYMWYGVQPADYSEKQFYAILSGGIQMGTAFKDINFLLQARYNYVPSSAESGNFVKISLGIRYFL